jgi:hypothetical protein
MMELLFGCALVALGFLALCFAVGYHGMAILWKISGIQEEKDEER